MRRLSESKIGSYSYSCLMAAISPEDRFSVIKSLTASLDPSDLVWGDGKGAELDPHVTVLYGIHEKFPRPFIDICEKVSPFSIRVSGLSTFEGDDYDVLKLDIESQELTDLNAFIRSRFEHTTSFPDYHPHLTIGYLKKGMAGKYGVGTGGTSMISSLNVVGFEFSSSSKSVGKVSIPCRNPNESLAAKLLSGVD
jgi:hypothetical protein